MALHSAYTDCSLGSTCSSAATPCCTCMCAERLQQPCCLGCTSPGLNVAHLTSVHSGSPCEPCHSTCRDAEERRRKQDEARADMMAANERQKQIKVCLPVGLPLQHDRHVCQP